MIFRQNISLYVTTELQATVWARKPHDLTAGAPGTWWDSNGKHAPELGQGDPYDDPAVLAMRSL